MKKIIQISILSFIVFFISCDKKDTLTIETTTDDEINYFVWRGLNTYYLHQQKVPDLADKRFVNLDELYTYFRGFPSPESVFINLLHQPNVVDKFSWIVDDYIALENSFQGLNVSNGMEFGLVEYKNGSGNVFGYVRYVVPSSSAAAEGITRGMIFNSINGSQLNLGNYRDLLFNDATAYTVGFADYNNGNPSANATSFSLLKTELQENPIAIAKVINEGSQKIGYLMYNQFARNYDGELNSVFADFKAQNINDLIIDLRYNPGGSTSSATYLSGMITGQFTGELFSQEIWNEKVTNANSREDFVNNFTDKIKNFDGNGTVILEENINSLGLNNVYFIVTGSSASASELVINCLDPYINVHLVGTKTVGKQVGSITVYDSNSFRKNDTSLNKNHTYAMQPLVLEITNKNKVNYPNGIIPGTTLAGFELKEDFGDLGVLGERSDPLLSRTLTYILTGAKPMASKKEIYNFNEVFNSKLATPASDRMFVDKKFLK